MQVGVKLLTAWSLLPLIVQQCLALPQRQTGMASMLVTKTHRKPIGSTPKNTTRAAGHGSARKFQALSLQRHTWGQSKPQINSLGNGAGLLAAHADRFPGLFNTSWTGNRPGGLPGNRENLSLSTMHNGNVVQHLCMPDMVIDMTLGEYT